MGRKKSGKKTEVVGLSINKGDADFLRKLPNSSSFVTEAIREKRLRDKDPMERLKEVIFKQEQLALELKKLSIQRTDLEDKIAAKKTKLKEEAIRLFRVGQTTEKVITPK